MFSMFIENANDYKNIPTGPAFVFLPVQTIPCLFPFNDHVVKKYHSAVRMPDQLIFVIYVNTNILAPDLWENPKSLVPDLI